jgi:alkane 1-monooxygenase
MARLVELANHLVALLLTPALVAFCLLARPAWPVELALWAAWLAAALLFDAWSPRVSAVAPADRPDGAAVLLLLWLPPLAMAGVLAWALALAERGAFDAGQFALAAFGLGLTTSTIGGGTAHELLHRRGRLARAAAQALTLFYLYPHYPIVHLRVHHAHTADPFDPGTSLLNEPLAAYVRRAMRLAWQGAWRVENRRLARLGLRPWHWRNRMTRALLVQAAFVAGIAALFGPAGLGLFLAQTVVAGLLILGIDYTQHYGVVRRTLGNGRLEPIAAAHAWTSDHAFNRSVFYLGLHSDHHLQPQASLAERGAAAVGAPQAPFGYPGLFLLAIIPPLWFRVMNPRLAEAQRQAG